MRPWETFPLCLYARRAGPDAFRDTFPLELRDGEPLGSCARDARWRCPVGRTLRPPWSVDVLESRLAAAASGRPDNAIAESGVLRELKGGAFRTRFGQHRADLKRQPLDLAIWAAPYLAIGVGLYFAAKTAQRT